VAVLLEQVMPDGVDSAMLDEVTTELNAAKEPPSGLVVHVHFMESGRARIVDVWESRADYDAFRTQRLAPAIEKVAQRRGVAMQAEPETKITEVDGLVRGPASLRDAVTTQSKLLVGRLSEEVNKRRGGAAKS